jgi:hypothetical protein
LAFSKTVPRALKSDTIWATHGERKVLAGEVIGQFRHFGRVGAARVQHGPAAPVDGARVLTVERHHVAPPVVQILGVEVRQRLPAATETDDLDVVLTTAVGDGFYDRVETRDVAATREDADSVFRHANPLIGLSRTCSNRLAANSESSMPALYPLTCVRGI